MLLTGLMVTGGICAVTILLYVYYMSRNHGMLKKYGITGPTYWPLVGNFYHEMKCGLSKYHKAKYLEYKAKGDKVYAHYRCKTASIVLTDLELAKDIYVKHFSNFTNRTDVKIEEPFGSAMTRLKDGDWKRVRTTVSPTFNTTRLKLMHQHIEVNTWNLLKHLMEKHESNEPLEMKDTFSKFTMDVIAATGFGIKVNSFDEADNYFVKEVNKIFSGTGKTMALMFFFDFLMPVLRLFGVSLVNKDTIKFLTGMVDTAVEQREQEMTTGKQRNDFLQLLLSAEKFTQAEDDNMTTEEAAALNAGHVRRHISHVEMQGQSMVFILAGYETVSTGMSFCMFMLARHPECLEKVQEEVDQVLQGKFPSYDDAQNLPYLEMCLFETMRHFPATPLLERVCNEEITLRGVTFPKDITVAIPVCAFHHDPEHWPEPERFDPERFTDENKAKRHPYAYMPFGQGPRMCIGMRLGLLEMKVGMAAILQRFTPAKCDKTVWPIEFVPFRVAAKDGLWVKLEARK